LKQKFHRNFETNAAAKTATRKPEEFYDNSVVQKLINEGFVEKLKKAK
jgi:uncharacterized protein YcnI